MHDDELLRYSRHILLDEIGIDGQERLLGARVLLVGAGGLGCAAAMYLAGAGVGRLTLVDDDTADLTNLQRQIGHTTDRIGQPKVLSLAAAIHALNPAVEVLPIAQRADPTLLDTQVHSADVVLDCSDNYATRQQVNAACVRHRKPLASGAALRFEGQLGLFALHRPGAACYACIFPVGAEPAEAACATMGVLAPLVGIVGATQAADALATLLEQADGRFGTLRMLDALRMEWASMRIIRDPHCAVCSPAHAGASVSSGHGR